MTQIDLLLADQLLTVVQQPTVASGDQNSVRIQVEFDSRWTDYTKSAVFFTAADPTVYEVALTSDTCIVPWEVLATDGVLYIGVRGVNTAQNKVKTSALVSYKIVKGAPGGTGTTVDPTTDAYAQIIARLEALEKGGNSGGGGISQETDPTVPEWAKQSKKPSYTAQEVGADPAGTAAEVMDSHNTDLAAHAYLHEQVIALRNRLNAALNSDDVDLDQLAEIVAYIKSNKTLIDAITTSKVSVADIVDNLTTNAANRPLSAAQGVALKALIDGLGSGQEGVQGGRGPGILKVTTAPTSYTTAIAGKNPIKRMAISTIESQAGVEEVLVGDCISHSYYLYHIYHLDSTYAYMDTSQSIRGAAGAAGAQGPQGETGAAGPQGPKGDNPVKGVDYYTESDKAEMVAMVLEALGGSVISGYVDEENNVVIMGLPEGDYTVKYELTDGSTIDIGSLVLAEVEPAPGYTNLAEPNPSNTTDFTVWCSNARMSGDGVVRASDGYTCTNFIALAAEDVIRVRGFRVERIGLYDTDQNALALGANDLPGHAANNYIYADYSQTDDATTFTIRALTPAFVRLSGWVNTTADAVVITKNEEIT